MNATDVIGWGWGFREGFLETPLHKQETKKDLAASNMSIFAGVEGSSARREAEFSKFKESGVGSCSSLRASPKEGRGAVLHRRSPRALCQAPVLGTTRSVGGLERRCSGPGPEVCTKLRQFAGRHFNCGFLHHRGPLAALRGAGGGDRAFRFCLAFSRLSPGLSHPHLPPSPWRPRRPPLRPLPAGAAGSSHPVGGGCLCRRSHAGGSPLAQECPEPLASIGA